MASKLSLVVLLLWIISCGREVKMTTNKLEQYSSITLADTEKISKTGMLKKTADSNQITLEGKTYKVSMYSSYLALEFIAKRPIGTETSIKFLGTMSGNEIILEKIE